MSITQKFIVPDDASAEGLLKAIHFCGITAEAMKVLTHFQSGSEAVLVYLTVPDIEAALLAVFIAGWNAAEELLTDKTYVGR